MTPTDSLIDDEVAALVSAAAAGSRPAWDELVDRYVGLLWSIARGFRLSESDAADRAKTPTTTAVAPFVRKALSSARVT